MHTSKFLFFYVFFHGVCKPFNEPETSGDWTHNITRRHFCSLPSFCVEHSFTYSIYFLFSEFFSVICLFWHTLTARDDTRMWQHTRQGHNEFTPQWHPLMRFFAGETSRALALLLTFAKENEKNLLLGLNAHEKIWARLVGKSIFGSKLRSPQRLIKESLAVCNLLFVYAVTL